MRPDHPASLRQLPALRLACGICLAVLYLLTTTPLAPGLTTLVAMADRSHRVAVRTTAHGIRLELRHDRLHAPTHHHGLAAHALTLLAQRTSVGHPDHVIQFGAGVTGQPTTVVAKPATGGSVPELFPPWDRGPRTMSPTAVAAALPRPPPCVVGPPEPDRSTVRLL